MSFDKELFDGKSFSSLLEDIYKNSKKKEIQINTLISELKPLIQNIGDATIIVPLIKEYLDVAVKNDDALVRMAAIVQRAMSRSDSGELDALLLTEDEKKQLMETLVDAESEPKETDKQKEEEKDGTMGQSGTKLPASSPQSESKS
mgnify:CR=1 FL=1|tara:strand:+ start:2533 stop:2970 length:438 start_codon:yes stop_codon:yes gene_type:complete